MSTAVAPARGPKFLGSRHMGGAAFELGTRSMVYWFSEEAPFSIRRRPRGSLCYCFVCVVYSTDVGNKSGKKRVR